MCTKFAETCSLTWNSVLVSRNGTTAPLKNTRHSYLDLLNNLKFDESDPILCSNKGELSCIFAFINDDNAEFILCVDRGLHDLVRDWLLDSTNPVFVNEC